VRCRRTCGGPSSTAFATRFDGLAALDPTERAALLGRIELGLSYSALAQALGKPSADAARMTVARALLKLTKAMNHP
jgi:RNA polymerase sigma-70 factor (ECF subfamily)